MSRTDTSDIERIEREARASRLVHARLAAGVTSARKAAARFGWNENTYKAHEQARNGFTAAVGDIYADAFKVSRKWLYLNIGAPHDQGDDVSVSRIPLISKISAGDLMRDDIADEALGWVTFSGLPSGDWIAMEVDGDSMDRISPPQSRILVNRSDKRLVTNACYIIADESGDATYKRFRSNPMRFEPVSTNSAHEPIFPDNEPTIVGRVKFSLIEM